MKKKRSPNQRAFKITKKNQIVIAPKTEEPVPEIEKANKSINDVEESLRRVADGSYGVCMTCGGLIARERLIQSPFVKTCTACQHRLEQRGE